MHPFAGNGGSWAQSGHDASGLSPSCLRRTSAEPSEFVGSRPAAPRRKFPKQLVGRIGADPVRRSSTSEGGRHNPPLWASRRTIIAVRRNLCSRHSFRKIPRARRHETEKTANRARARIIRHQPQIAQGTLALEPIAADYAHRAALRAGPLGSNPPNRPSRHWPTKSAHCRGLHTSVSLDQTAIARIVRRHTTGAMGNSAPRFRIAYSTMNSVVPKR